MYKAQLRSRTKSPKESLQDLSFSIQRLISRAYPQALLSTHEEIAKDYFIDALPGENDMRLLVRRSKPRNIHEALRDALELEAIQNAESKSIGPRHSVRLAGSTEKRSKEYQKISNDVRNLKDTVDKLSKSVQQLLTKANITSQPSQNTSSVSANSGSQHNKIIVTNQAM